MFPKREDYSFLLDNLKKTAQEYYLDNTGKVFDINGQDVNDANIILNTKFYTLYCLAYKEIAEKLDNYPIKSIDQVFIVRALSDYGIFNTFINDCVIEYNMYNSVGTGYLSYFPYNELADYFFKEFDNNRLLVEYLNSFVIQKEETKGVRI